MEEKISKLKKYCKKRNDIAKVIKCNGVLLKRSIHYPKIYKNHGRLMNAFANNILKFECNKKSKKYFDDNKCEHELNKLHQYRINLKKRKIGFDINSRSLDNWNKNKKIIKTMRKEYIKRDDNI
jgi:hypothetical protein